MPPNLHRSGVPQAFLKRSFYGRYQHDGRIVKLTPLEKERERTAFMKWFRATYGRNARPGEMVDGAKLSAWWGRAEHQKDIDLTNANVYTSLES
jgi:hypothetical protein